MSDAETSVRPLDMRRWTFRFVIRSYLAGPDAEGEPRFDSWLADPPPGGPPTPQQVNDTINFLGMLLVRLGHEVDAAQAQGRAADVAAFFHRWETGLMYLEMAQAERVSVNDIIEREETGAAAANPDRQGTA